MQKILKITTILALCGLTACNDFSRHPQDSFDKDFSPLLYPMGHSIPAQWEGKNWDPAQWPLSYQNKDNFTKGLFKADIIRDQYIKDETVPVLVVGPNFYHLSDHDQIRVCDTINMLYGATSGSYGAFLLTDWYSKKIIGEYSKGGLSLR